MISVCEPSLSELEKKYVQEAIDKNLAKSKEFLVSPDV